MSKTLQLEEAVEVHDGPKLLVEWTPRWQDFVTSIRPALARSTARLAGETPFGLRPYRTTILACAGEAFAIFVAIVLPNKIAELRPYVAPKLATHEVIYYSGDELPRTEDLGGAQSGTSGKAGGSEAHHRTQTIRVARGGSLTQQVVDAPNLKLPSSRDAVANLLAIRPNPGPPPSEGLRSSRTAPSLTTPIVAPAPSVIRDFTRGGMTLDAVVAPAPSVSRDKTLSAPALNSTVIPPAPNMQREHALVAPALDARVIAPAPDPFREKGRPAPSLNPGVIAPAPQMANRDVSRAPVQITESAVVPPPVSAPVRDSGRTAKVSLPAPSVIAPPPTSDMSQDLRRLSSGTISDPSKNVVPPPPAPSGNGSFMSSLVGKIFGASEVVPPPPSVAGGAGVSGSKGTSLTPNVVAPPPTVGGGASGNPQGRRGGSGNSLAANVVPPPPSLSGSGGGAGNATGGNGNPRGTLLASNVIPPPPSVGGGNSSSGTGGGSRGTGMGKPMNAGSVLAPPANGGSGGSSSAVVVSSAPGAKVGLPNSGGAGSLAMSPAGGDKPGVGGSGGGTSLGHGDGPGSGMTKTGSGAGKTGTEHGSDPNAHGGISPNPGPGGAGNGTNGTPPVPGLDIQGGSSAVVNLPSFGSDGSSPSRPAGRSSLKEQQGPAITIVATSRSGGAFNFYGKLPGDNYTVYVDTNIGMVVMQFADPTSATHAYSGTLTGPQALHADLPVGMPHARMVVACTLDASGNLKNLQVQEAGPAAMTAKVMAALAGWKFRPAMRNNQPVEVNALLGFGIDTNDR